MDSSSLSQEGNTSTETVPTSSPQITSRRARLRRRVGGFVLPYVRSFTSLMTSAGIISASEPSDASTTTVGNGSETTHVNELTVGIPPTNETTTGSTESPASSPLPPRSTGVKRASAFKLLPSRVVSRAYGVVSDWEVPPIVRPILYGAWALAFGARLDEAAAATSEYRTLTHFFTRRLRPGARVIDERQHVMVSPCDGRIVSLSNTSDSAGLGAGCVKSVKGVDYQTKDFLGLTDLPPLRPGNDLFSVVVYLSPADYHRFHSHTEWVAMSRTHIAGQLLPVNPVALNVLPSLFCANERVVLLGEWAHGFMSYTAVGATNVGRIRISLEHEKDLRTNQFKHDWACGIAPLEVTGFTGNSFYRPKGTVERKQYSDSVALTRGDEVGMFELGSTIVLVFEAPADFRFTARPGDRVRLGSAIGMTPLGEGETEEEEVAVQDVDTNYDVDEPIIEEEGEMNEDDEDDLVAEVNPMDSTSADVSAESTGESSLLSEDGICTVCGLNTIISSEVTKDGTVIASAVGIKLCMCTPGHGDADAPKVTIIRRSGAVGKAAAAGVVAKIRERLKSTDEHEGVLHYIPADEDITSANDGAVLE